MRVRLEAQEGCYVGTFKVPDFNVPPKVIAWGTRLFAFYRWVEDSPRTNKIAVYRESFAYTITTKPITEDDGA